MSFKILERLKKQLSSQGNSIDKVENMAVNILRKHGILKKDTIELTDYGITRNNMTSSDRAIDRVRKINGRNKEEYHYDPYTNRATLKKNMSKVNLRRRRKNAI